MTSTKRYAKLVSFGFWSLIWGIFSKIIDNDIILPTPLKVFKQVGIQLTSLEALGSIFRTCYRISLGLFMGLVLGVLLGALAHFFKPSKAIIDLPVEFIKATPIAAITIILLIWISYKSLTSYIVGLVVGPNIYISVYSSLNSINKEILEMKEVFNVSFLKSLRYIYFEEVKKNLIPVIIISVGMAFKAGISAEVLALIGNSIGEYIYYSKVYLWTTDLLAWTIIIVMMSKTYEQILVYFLKKVK